MWAGEKKKVDRKKFEEERKTGQVRGWARIYGDRSRKKGGKGQVII